MKMYGAITYLTGLANSCKMKSLLHNFKSFYWFFISGNF